MPLHALLRITAILVTMLIVTQSKDVVWWSLFWSVAFVHYGLALYYSRKRIIAVASRTHSLVPALAVISGGAALYVNQFSLLIYFGIHHVFNEVYLLDRKLPVADDEKRRELRVSAILLNAFIYAVLLRHYSELAWIDPTILFGGLFISYVLFFYRLNRLRPFLGAMDLIDSCAFEMSGLLLVLFSLFAQLNLNYIVFYHFVFWSLYPIEKFNSQGGGALVRYLTVSVLLMGFFLLFSPMGVVDRVVSERYYYQQFIFWSYAHITLSFVLSDAHPVWITRWFRSARKQWAIQ